MRGVAAAGEPWLHGVHEADHPGRRHSVQLRRRRRLERRSPPQRRDGHVPDPVHQHERHPASSPRCRRHRRRRDAALLCFPLLSPCSRVESLAASRPGRVGPGTVGFGPRPGASVRASRFSRYKDRPSRNASAPNLQTLGARFAFARVFPCPSPPAIAGILRREPEIYLCHYTALCASPRGSGSLYPRPSTRGIWHVTSGVARGRRRPPAKAPAAGAGQRLVPISFLDSVCILEGSAFSRNSALAGCYSKMVCMAGQFKMASVLKLVMMGNHATPDEVINEKSASHILHKQLLGAHEPNLLDEDDMHIFGSKPMADPLDLVCCDTCQKPVKASQYAPHAERCSSRMVNPNGSMGLEEDADPMKPPKKGRKIKLTSNGNKKVYIKVKAKSQSENKNTVNDFELTNGNANKPLNSTADQRLKAATSYPEYHFRDVPAPLATKMYHSQGNYRLRFELGQLYRESCAEQSHNYESNTSLNSSQVNGLIPCDHSALHGSNNSVTHVAPNKFKPRTKHLDQLPATTSELCSGIPQKLSASGSSHPQASKSQRADTQVSAVRNESARSRSNKAAVLSSKNTGKKKK